jgi:hypothetical protein
MVTAVVPALPPLLQGDQRGCCAAPLIGELHQPNTFITTSVGCLISAYSHNCGSASRRLRSLDAYNTCFSPLKASRSLFVQISRASIRHATSIHLTLHRTKSASYDAEIYA